MNDTRAALSKQTEIAVQFHLNHESVDLHKFHSDRAVGAL